MSSLQSIMGATDCYAFTDRRAFRRVFTVSRMQGASIDARIDRQIVRRVCPTARTGAALDALSESGVSNLRVTLAATRRCHGAGIL
jgi:hypothetical protein